MSVDHLSIITLEPDKRGGRACIRGTRIAVAGILGWLAEGQTVGEMIADLPELTESDIRAALAFAADRERRTGFVTAREAPVPAEDVERMRRYAPRAFLTEELTDEKMEMISNSRVSAEHDHLDVLLDD